jgi:sugar transferase (PEP-CTERM/EpsH1 system associated)
MRAGVGSAEFRPLVVHVVYRFAVGGLENGIVNLINRLPQDRFRHAVVALTEVTDFRQRITRGDTEFVSLHKPAGHGVKLYPQLARLFRRLQPQIVHTRNLAALEAQVPAWWAGVPVRVHGEHGRDIDDLDGTSRKHQWLRRIYKPFVHQYVALSRDLERYLVERVGVPADRIEHAYNGVDSERFAPPPVRQTIAGSPFTDPRHLLVGTVGRMAAVKDQATLVRAFIRALQVQPAARERLRLVLVGDGPERAAVQDIVRSGGVGDLVWFAGERSDVSDVMRGLDLFVLPSLAEGISNTVLEAMSCARPVVATRVGANADLMEQGAAGTLVERADPAAMAAALLTYMDQPALALRHGQAGREIVERRFSLARMVANYGALYERLLARRVAGTGRTRGATGRQDAAPGPAERT